MSEYGIYDFITRTAAMPGARVNVLEGTRPDSLLPLGANTNPNVGNSPAEVKAFPQFIQAIKVATDNIMYFDTAGAGWTKTDLQNDFYTKVLTGLPSGVSRFRDGVFYAGQDVTGRAAEYIVILTNNQDLWYNEKSTLSWTFKGWKQITRKGVLAGNIFRLFKISDAVLALAGRFQDANGDYFGLANASGKNVEAWSVYQNSKLSRVNGSKSYARGTSTMLNGDVVMYGRLLNDEGTNLLTATITTGPFTAWSTKGVPGLLGVEEMCSLVDTEGGRMGMVVPYTQTVNNILGCGAPGGSAAAFAFWDPEKRMWNKYPDILDVVSNDSLNSFGVLFPHLYTNFKRTTFAVLVKCNAPVDANATLYQVNFIPSGSKPPEILISKIMVSAQPNSYELKYGQLQYEPGGSVPIVVTGVAEPSPAAAVAPKEEPDPFSLFKNKYFWLGVFVVLALGGTLLYVNMVESIGQSHVQSEALIKEYLEKLKQSQ